MKRSIAQKGLSAVLAALVPFVGSVLDEMR